MERMWEIKQSSTPGTLELYIYGDVKSDGRDWWTGQIIKSETSANHFREELAKHPNVTQINIYINSYGGCVFEGTAIYTQLKRHAAHKTVYIDGFACSIASVIAMAGDEIVMPKNTLMICIPRQIPSTGFPALTYASNNANSTLSRSISILTEPLMGSPKYDGCISLPPQIMRPS